MKILHVSTGLSNNGAEGVLTRLAIADRNNQHEVVSLLGDGALGQVLRDEGIPTHPMNIRSPLRAITSFVQLILLIRRSKPDIVQCWMYHANLFGGLAAWIAGASKIAWNVRTIPNKWLPVRSRAIIAAGASLSRVLPTTIVCAGDEVGLAHHECGYAKDKLVVIDNGIDVNRFRPDPAKRRSLRLELGIPAEEWLIGRVARDVPQKDHVTLFSALANLASRGQAVRCLLVGTGMEDSNASLQALARKAGVENLLICVGPRGDVDAVGNAIDLFVSSSCVEGFPNAIAEAMACGVPVAATDAGASAQIIGPAGWVVPVGDGVKLADAIASARKIAISKPKSWLAMKSACSERISANFSMRSMLRSYQMLWRGVIRPATFEVVTASLESTS